MTIRYPGGKLVRDRTPQIALERGDDAHFTEAKDLLAALKRKLVEEAFEVGAACSTKDLAEELADVRDISIAIAREAGVTEEDIAEASKKKNAERGGFNQGVILESYRAGALR